MLVESKKRGYLYTTGFIPRLKTFPYQGVPYPLNIEICQGEADLFNSIKRYFDSHKIKL